MGCPPVRGDNPRALASGLSYVQVDKHGITIYTTNISVDLTHREIFRAKVIKGGINQSKKLNSTYKSKYKIFYSGLSAWGAACLYGFRIYLIGTVGQGCSQFIRFLDLFRNVFYSKISLYFSHL